MNNPDITLTYEEYMELVRLKVRVDVLADFIKEYGNDVTINEAIAILNLEVEKDA
jgi:hypothetical protein